MSYVSLTTGQLLYLPLDGDLTDHSGIGHDGVVPSGMAAPTFTCLDKAVNCSAVFRYHMVYTDKYTNALSTAANLSC